MIMLFAKALASPIKTQRRIFPWIWPIRAAIGSEMLWNSLCVLVLKNSKGRKVITSEFYVETWIREQTNSSETVKGRQMNPNEEHTTCYRVFTQLASISSSHLPSINKKPKFFLNHTPKLPVFSSPFLFIKWRIFNQKYYRIKSLLILAARKT